MGYHYTSIAHNFLTLTLVGYLGLEPRAYRLKAEYSTIELVTQGHFILNNIRTEF